jgi:hypothetical protein
MCSELVQVVLQDGLLHPEPIIGNLEDISPSGGCIQVEEAIREGTDIEILCGGCTLRGKVERCRFVTLGYDVGISFDQKKSWVRNEFEPEHLLDIPARAAKG